MKSTKIKSETVYVLHHTNAGTPEANQIHSIHKTLAAAKAKMVEVLDDYYEITVQENNKWDMMYINKQVVKNQI